MAGPFAGLTGNLPRDPATGALLVSGGGSGGKVADVAVPFTVGHRGSELTGPENTLENFRQSVARGGAFVDVDAWRLGDGSFGVIHDNTLDRTTTTTGPIAKETAGSWLTRRIDSQKSNNNDAAFVNWPTNLRLPLLHEVLAEFGGKVPILIEGKDTGAGAQIAAIIKSYGLQQSVLYQDFTLAELQGAHAVDPTIPLMLIAADASIPATPAALLAQGINWISPDITGTGIDAAIPGWVSAGLKVVPYQINRHYLYDQYLAMGAVGCLSNDAGYVSKRVPRTKTDPFALQVPYPGMQSQPGISLYRGEFKSPNKLHIPNRASAFTYLLQGWACPIGGFDANGNKQVPTTYSISVPITFETLPSDMTRFTSIVFGCPTDQWSSNGAGAGDNGYRFDFKADGTLTLVRVTAGASSTLQTITTGLTPVTAGQRIVVTIDVTPTVVKVTRGDTGQIVQKASESTFRGGYFHFGRSDASATGLTVSWDTVTITP